MADDLYATVLFSDGESLEPDDLNNISRFTHALVTDQLLQYTAGSDDFGGDPEMGGQNGSDVPAVFAYCPAPGAAFLREGSANHKIQIAPGTLFQKIDTSDGLGSTLVPFTFAGTEEWTLTDGDVTNPRVDLLQMKLEYIEGGPEARNFEDATTRAKSTTNPDKRRSVQCTLSVKAGTPGASPTVPTADSGFVPVGLAMVGNGWTTVGTAPIFGVDTTATNNLVIHDVRMPMRVRAHRVDPVLFKLVTAWALSNTNSTVTSSNATNDLYVPYPGGAGRLVGIGVHHVVAMTNAGNSALLGSSSGILTTTFLKRNSAGFTAPATFGPDCVASRHKFEYGGHADSAHNPSAGPVISSSADFIGPPLWTNGQRCLTQRQLLGLAGAASIPIDTLVLRLQTGVNAHVIGAVTFYVAEGL